MLSEITLDPDILREMGPQVAVVHAILAANNRGGGTSMTHAQVAKTAGIARITARRCIDKLRNAGLLKSQAQFQDNWRQANLYQIPTCVRPADGEQTHDHTEQTPAHIEQANSTYSTTHTSPSSSSEEENQEVDYPYPGVAREGLRPSGVNNVGQGPQGQPGPGGEAPPPSHRWTPPGTPMPVASRESGPWRNFFDLYAEAYWLVMHFEGHVLRMNQELQLLGKKPRDSVGEYRRQRFLRSALRLLERHPLAEVVEVIDWVFTECSGHLPFPVENEYTHTSSLKDRKVTNLQKILDHYAELTSSMADKQIHPLEDMADVPRGPGIDYGKPFADVEMESKVSELVSSFTDFRTVCGDQGITDFRTWGWAKTFRIMLAKYSSEDIKAGIVALAACRDRLDVSRYHDAFHLNQEWQQVLGVVDLHKVIQQEAVKHVEPENRWESPPPSVSFLLDDDDDSPRYAKDSTSVRHIDMATNLEERRARYAARAAKNRGTA
jgi:hypothetical protein